MDDLVRHIEPKNLYQQVADDLLQRITGGQFEAGDMLPPESALCDQYGVSRITVRSAILRLVDRGLLVRKRGVGTFVTGRDRTSAREFNLVGFLDDSRAFTSTPVLNEAEVADERVASALKVEVGTGISHIRSVVRRNGEALTVVDAYSLDTPDGRMSEEDFHAQVPSVHAMGMRIGRRIERAEQELDAVAADEVAALYLEIAEGTPIVRARRVYFTSSGERLHYLVIRYHPARYRFNVDLVVRSSAAAFETMREPRKRSKQAKAPRSTMKAAPISAVPGDGGGSL